MRTVLRLIGRDIRLALRSGSDAGAVLGFFVVAVALFPLAIGPEQAILARIAAGTVWVAALLAALLSLERLFVADHEDGALDLLALSPLPLEAVALAKIAAHWLITGVPLILAAPVLALLMNLPTHALWVLMGSLALGTPSLSLIGAMGAALTLGSRRGGALLGLLVLPLAVPVLIFGAASVDAAVAGLPARPHLLLLGGVLALALPLAPIAAAAALRQALE